VTVLGKDGPSRIALIRRRINLDDITLGASVPEMPPRRIRNNAVPHRIRQPFSIAISVYRMSLTETIRIPKQGFFRPVALWKITQINPVSGKKNNIDEFVYKVNIYIYK